MKIKKFQKRVENFTCINCNKDVVGDGFTNHCPECFYSMHVDIFPGDRMNKCGGILEPVYVEKNGVEKNGFDRYLIKFKCQKCKKEVKDKFRHKTDNFDNLIKIVQKINRKK
jgi:Zn finger protein HypA/HybF involved in hydrogenase expression